MSDWRDSTCAECGEKCFTGQTHLEHNAGWRKKMLSRDYTDLALAGFPGWETKDQGGGWGVRPPYVELCHVNGEGKPSGEIAREWDDIATCRFYSRDISYDGSPFVAKGEGYGSGWTFEKLVDAVAFAKKYGGSVQ